MAQPASSAENWKSLGFSQLQQTLDEQSTKIYESQEEGVASRRALSSQTKAFRKLSDEEKLSEVRSLLKNYQSEIDALTSRTKFAEQCFMTVYKSLALLPDPAPLLDAQRAEIDALKSQAASGSRPSDEDSRLARELERQTLRVSQLEKQLKAANKAGAKPSDSMTTDTNRGGAAESRDSTSDSIQHRIDALETELAQRKLQLTGLQTSLKDQAALAQRYQSEHQLAVKQLAAQRDYDSLKRELQELKQRPVGAGEDDGESSSEASASGVNARRQIKTLETQTQQLTAERDSLKRDLDQVRHLAGKLEDDLSAMQSSDSFSTISGWTAVPRGGPGRPAGSTVTGSGNGASAVSGIIMQQRDRYKKRMQELEEKLHKSEAELTQTKKELESVKRESYKLYDRIRLLQAQTSTAVAAPSTSLHSAAPPLYEPTVEQKLKELDLDRRLVDQSPLQVKLLELSARALVDAKFRMGSAAYIGALHLLLVLGLIF